MVSISKSVAQASLDSLIAYAGLKFTAILLSQCPKVQRLQVSVICLALSCIFFIVACFSLKSILFYTVYIYTVVCASWE